MPQPDPRRIIGTLCLAGASVSVVSAVAYNEFLLARLDANPPLAQHTVLAIRSSQLNMFVCAIVLALLSEVIHPQKLSRALQRLLGHPVGVNVTVALLLTLLPLALAEWALQPIVRRTVQKTTTLFVKDDYLGWRLRPNTEDVWGGVTVNTNGKGLRGPEVSYDRRDRAARLLYLGDSVTFGYRLGSYKDSYPYAVESVLEQQRNIQVETINAGVGGYSPWQYYRYLESEGVKYDPDLVVVGFVLNDVTEKFNLTRFGGGGAGRQLSESYFSLHEWLKHNSGIYGTIVRIATSLRFRGNPQATATAQEKTRVEDLVRSPDREDVQNAWRITLENFGRIADFCKTRDLPLAIVIFPYALQFEDPDRLSAPQAVVTTFARERGVPCLDLLPLLSQHAQSPAMSPADLFLDHGHLTRRGNRIVAETIASFLAGNTEITRTWPTGDAER